jgi:hypothetical protein
MITGRVNVRLEAIVLIELIGPESGALTIWAAESGEGGDIDRYCGRAFRSPEITVAEVTARIRQ